MLAAPQRCHPWRSQPRAVWISGRVPFTGGRFEAGIAISTELQLAHFLLVGRCEIGSEGSRSLGRAKSSAIGGPGLSGFCSWKGRSGKGRAGLAALRMLNVSMMNHEPDRQTEQPPVDSSWSPIRPKGQRRHITAAGRGLRHCDSARNQSLLPRLGERQQAAQIADFGLTDSDVSSGATVAAPAYSAHSARSPNRFVSPVRLSKIFSKVTSRSPVVSCV